jgi:pilus assembly protein CpaB
MGRRTLLLVAAFVVAALGTTLVFLYVNGVNDRAVADQKQVQVLVASSEIPAGMTGAQADGQAKFAIRKITKSSVVDGALGDSSSIQNRVAVAPIFPGEQILSSKFATSASTSTLVVPSGKLAVAINAGDPNRLGGFLTPGANVTVFVTRTDRGPPETQVLLPSVEVIGIGDRTLTSGPDAAASQMLTLAVNQNQAQQVITAGKIGELYFALRAKNVVIDPRLTTTPNQIGP